MTERQLRTFQRRVRDWRLKNGKKQEVFADKDMVQTILRNLVNNAIKFSYKDSNITIAVRSENDMVEVSVKDQGRGIKEEHKIILFDNNNFVTTRGTNNEKGIRIYSTSISFKNRLFLVNWPLLYSDEVRYR